MNTVRVTKLLFGFASVLFLTASPQIAKASSGTEGASFLDIPVGGRPAALGSAYSALAMDAYAPTANPAGLGLLEDNQFAGQHLSYVDSIHYEYLSFVHPLRPGRSLGGAIQYLGSGDINQTDLSGNTIGTFSSHFAAYTLAYGQQFNDKLSLGVSGKIINEKISDVSANAFGVDFGSLYRYLPNLTFAASLTNIGSKLTFIDQGDPLPLAFHLGAAYGITSQIDLAGEWISRRTGLNSLHTGVEWRPLDAVALRLGYRTDTLKGLSPLAGLTMGIGLKAFGQEFDYAWLPLGDLGNTQYFSLVIHFGKASSPKRNLIHYQQSKPTRSVNKSNATDDELMEIFDDADQKPVASAAKNARHSSL